MPRAGSQTVSNRADYQIMKIIKWLDDSRLSHHFNRKEYEHQNITNLIWNAWTYNFHFMKTRWNIPSSQCILCLKLGILHTWGEIVWRKLCLVCVLWLIMEMWLSTNFNNNIAIMAENDELEVEATKFGKCWICSKSHH